MKGMVREMSKTKSIAKDSGRTASYGKVTSINGAGKMANVQVDSNVEVRELTIVLPYGISSSALDNMSVQVILNTSNSGAVIGTIDDKRPNALPGQLILYDKSGSSISMLNDGKIILTPGNGGAPLVIG